MIIPSGGGRISPGGNNGGGGMNGSIGGGPINGGGGKNGGGGRTPIGEPGDSKCIGDGALLRSGIKPSMLL